MRTPADLPRRIPRASRRTRIIVVAAVVAVIFLILSLSGLARFWTDYLWFQSVGFTSVFRGVLLTKVLLALVFMAIFFLMMWGNLVIADRVAPDQPAPGTADELVVRYREVVSPHATVVRIVTAAVFALLAGIGANRQWNNWDLLRYHVSFGTADPEYHIDIGFYVFDLPFIKFLLGWTFEALIVVFIVTTVAHYLNGGIHVQGPERRITPAVKTHLSVLLGVLALIKAVDYYFERLELVLSRDHIVNGATATSVHADKPALTLLIAIAVIAAGLFFYNIRQKGWMLPAVAVALWILVYILVGLIYPALYQALRVNPSQLSRETPYISRNIMASRAAYGLNSVQVDSSSAKNGEAYNYSPTVTSAQIQGNSPQAVANQRTLANVRMLDPAVQLTNTFDKYQGQYSYYNFNNLAQDRYQLPDPGSPNSTQETATIASVRELNTSLPSSGFVAQHLQYTHGYGAVLAPISENGVNTDGTPNFSLSDLPPTGTPPLGEKNQGQGSEIYYGIGNATGGYVIADSKTDEIDYQSSTTGQAVTNRYQGSGGVEAGSIVRRAAFALRFGDANFILSGQITPTSRVMYYRNIGTMVHKAAPFLKYDADPYAVVLNNQLFWVMDAYTTTDNYPYSQNANTTGMPAGSGLNTTFNYARNSVKVVIDAYSGKMYFFVVDKSDPIIQVYQKAFPDLFIPVSKANGIKGLSGITAHFRYPEDLFRVQTTMYGRYHLTKPGDFYSGSAAWSVSPDPGSGQLSSSSSYLAPSLGANGQPLPPQVARLAPQYILAHPPGSTQQSFMAIIPYVPVGAGTERQNLTAWMTASSDWNSQSNPYGTLTVYETPPDQTVDGPGLISSIIHSSPQISSELTLLNQQGSNVELGEVVVVPLDQTLLYVQTIYVESSSNQIPTLKDVVVVYDGKVYHSSNASLDNALCGITNPDGSLPFSSYCNTAAAVAAPLVQPGGTSNGGNKGTTTPSTTVPSSPTTTPAGPPPAGSSVNSLLGQAQASFNAADAALRKGDLAGYQHYVQQAETYVKQADALASKSKK
jgi:uncharacterized membrane protein (UPF0182 family)